MKSPSRYVIVARSGDHNVNVFQPIMARVTCLVFVTTADHVSPRQQYPWLFPLQNSEFEISQ